MVTKGREKSTKCGVGGDQEKQQLSFLDFILSALRKSMVLTCRIDEHQNEDLVSAVHHMEIGWPTNVNHITHVTYDRFHGFLGLPLEFEVEIPCKALGASVTVCGVSADSMKWSYDARCNSVPTILLLMQEKLYALGGLKAEGIFRINPENSEEGHVRDHLNRGIVPDEIDVHCLAGLIKAWFRELPSGVLDGLSPKQVLQCDAEEDCVELIEHLKPTESCLLGWTVDLMADVVEHEESNKMSARNIAMVFSPNMTKMSDPLTALMHAVQVTNLLQTLITRRLRERGEAEAAAGYSPVSLRLSDRHECETAGTASEDEELPPYSPISEDKYESDSLSDIEYCFSRKLDVHDNAKDGFRKQLERIILCRDQSSPITGSTLHLDSSVSFFDSSTSDDDDDDVEDSRSSSIAKNSRF